MYNCIKFPSSDRYIFRNIVLKNSFPEQWFKIIDRFTNIDTLISPLEYVYCGHNNFKSINKVRTKDLRELLTYNSCDKIDFAKFRVNFNVTSIPENIFTDIRKQTINSKLRFTHYRILHNDIYTKKKLNKIGITDNPLCDRCLSNNHEIIEDINHLLLMCPTTIECWKITETVLSNLTNENIVICKKRILFGFNYTETRYFLALNTILAKVRNNFIQINRPVTTHYDKIILNQIKEIIYIEKLFLNLAKFNKKWRYIANNVECLEASV